LARRAKSASCAAARHRHLTQHHQSTSRLASTAHIAHRAAARHAGIMAYAEWKNQKNALRASKHRSHDIVLFSSGIHAGIKIKSKSGTARSIISRNQQRKSARNRQTRNQTSRIRKDSAWAQISKSKIISEASSIAHRRRKSRGVIC